MLSQEHTCETESQTVQRVLKSGRKTLRVQGARVVHVSVQGVSGHQCKVLRNQLARIKLDFHIVQISHHQYVEKVAENLRQKLNFRRMHKYSTKRTYVLICGLFMSTTMKASVHLGPSYNENLVAYRNTNFKELRALFDSTQRLILEQSIEILKVSAMIWRFTPWMRSTCHDQVYKKQKSTSTQILSCVWEGCMIIQKRMRNGKVNWKTSNKPTHSELFFLESMENHLSSSGIFPRACIIGHYSSDPKRSGSSTNKSRTVCRKNPLRVDVQRC